MLYISSKQARKQHLEREQAISELLKLERTYIAIHLASD